MSDRTINRLATVIETVTDFVCLTGALAFVALMAGLKAGAI